METMLRKSPFLQGLKVFAQHVIERQCTGDSCEPDDTQQGRDSELILFEHRPKVTGPLMVCDLRHSSQVHEQQEVNVDDEQGRQFKLCRQFFVGSTLAILRKTPCIRLRRIAMGYETTIYCCRGLSSRGGDVGASTRIADVARALSH